MSRKTSPHIGRFPYRQNFNPQEKRNAEVWQKWNGDEKQILKYILTANSPEDAVVEQHAETVATVIQWLGSPVGEEFLSECGYQIKEGAQ